jgi:hypothetical protein
LDNSLMMDVGRKEGRKVGREEERRVEMNE